MKERPILFSAPMVRAILEGRKTQTRRVVKPQPDFDNQWIVCATPKKLTPELLAEECPFGQPGDHLWVREGLTRKPACLLGIEATNGVESAHYSADDCDLLNDSGFNICPWWGGKSLSAIYMPRWASRIDLEITGIRVERLQEISEEDCIAEGIEGAHYAAMKELQKEIKQ